MIDLKGMYQESKGVRLANFIMMSMLLSEIARTKGEDATTWLHDLRERCLQELDAAQETDQIKEVSKTAIMETFITAYEKRHVKA